MELGITDLVNMSVKRREADAKMIGVGFAEFRDVVRDRAAGFPALKSAWRRSRKRNKGVFELAQAVAPVGCGRREFGRRRFHCLTFCRAIGA